MEDQAREQPDEQPTSKPRRHGAEHLAPYAWKPGQSGNPGGRVPTLKLSKAIQAWLDDGGQEEALRKLVGIVRGDNSGSALEALRMILDRTEGKVTQTHRIEAARPKRVILEGGTLRQADDQADDQARELHPPSESPPDA